MDQGLGTNMPVGILLQTVASRLRCFVLIKINVKLSMHKDAATLFLQLYR